MSEFLELCSNFARRSGAHGFHDIDWHKKIALKIFWILMCLLAWAMFTYQVVIFSIKYYSYPISTKVSVAFDPSAPFPAISICNLNPIRYSKLPADWDADFLYALERPEPELPPLPNELGNAIENGLPAINDLLQSGPLQPGSNTSGLGPNISSVLSQSGGPAANLLNNLPGNLDTFYLDETTPYMNFTNPTAGTPQDPISGISNAAPAAGVTGPPNSLPAGPLSNINIGGPAPKTRRKRATKSRRPPPKSWNERKTEIEGYSDDEVEMDRPYEVDIQDQFYRAFYQLDFDKKKDIGHQIEDMLMECIWQEQQCFPEYQFAFQLKQGREGEGNFTHFYHQLYGNCYSFNAGWEGDALHVNRKKKILETNMPGSKGGLELVLYVEEKEYVPLLASHTGVRVHIHHQEKLPLPANSGFTASTGFNTNLEIRKNKISRLGKPYHAEGCELNMTSAMENMRGRYYWPLGKYSVDSCLKLCYQQELFSGCECIDPKLQAPPTLTPCADEKRTCKDRVQRQFRRDEGAVNCRSKCVAACDTIDYKVRSSYAAWPNEQYLDLLKYSMSGRSEEVNDLLNDPRGEYNAETNLLKMKVYFQRLNYDYITEEPDYELFDFLGDIGGSVGLWVGMSVLAAIQCLEFLLEVLIFFCTCKEDKQVIDEGPGKRGRLGSYEEDYEDDVSYVPRPATSAELQRNPSQIDDYR